LSACLLATVLNEQHPDRFVFLSLDSFIRRLCKIVPTNIPPMDENDVSNRPEEPKIENYEWTTIDGDGTAMLRQMGWKEGDPIGDTNKAVTPIFEPQFRARGVGLGADISDVRKQLENINVSNQDPNH